MPHISIVSPVYQAEDCVGELCKQLKAVLCQITDSFEIILVDDRSQDKSWSRILSEAQIDPRIKGIRLARNFGQHRAITAGLDHAQGDWVVVMDCDLQDPPAAILDLYTKAQEGYQIVVAEFQERVESPFRQKISRGFWGLLSRLAGIRFDHRVGNFRIMSRRAVQSFISYREQLRLLGGITALMGFTTTTVSIDRGRRFAGKTSYSLRRLVSSAVEIIMAYSDRPLKISIAVGLSLAIVSVLAGAWILLLRLAGGVSAPGWASVMISLYFMGGLIILNLGIVGFYVGKTFEETKKRPLYVMEAMTAAPARIQPRKNGRVLWITGLSGSGKSTLAQLVGGRLREQGEPVVIFDGDELRSLMSVEKVKTNPFDRETRMDLSMKYSGLCKSVASQGYTVIIATISLFKEVHDWNRANLPGYFEAYLKVPIDELRRRDPKGIYKMFESGETTSVAGLDFKVDEPECADWVAPFDPGIGPRDLGDQLLNAFGRATT